MLLAVDVGNTQTVLGLLDGEALVGALAGRDTAQLTADDLAVVLEGLLDLQRPRPVAQVEASRCRRTVPVLGAEWAGLSASATWDAPAGRRHRHPQRACPS